MPLPPGSRLGPYEIAAPLGAGGMGEVYRGRDTRLDRAVAIKILPEQLAADPQFRERFDREARAISQLTHPHICTLYDVGEQDGVAFLVMELLDGESLASRLEKGALPTAQALSIAVDLAAALDAAHRAGIVHRDLKPGNVVLTKSGAGSASSPQAKLLDFGLAKTGAAVATVSGTMMATAPASITAQGTILGTFQYMAPEQIEGLDADARTDIFAFGCVLFEMLTGKKAFEGKTRASLIGAILKDEPPPVSQLSTLALSMSKGEPDARGSTGSPRAASLDRVVATCLAKDPDDRWQSARDLMRELKWVADGGGAAEAIVAGVPAVTSRRRWLQLLPWAVAATLALTLLSVVVVQAPWRTPPAARPRKLLASIGADASLSTDLGASAILSPDGSMLAFVARPAADDRLFIRRLDQLQATQLAGTDGAASPFFSPDGQWIGFFAAGKLKKVSVAGGAAVNLCDAPNGRGGTWVDEDTIIFTPTNAANVALMRVAAGGGTPARFTTLPNGGTTTQRWPQALPGRRGVIYTEHKKQIEWDEANVMVVPLSGAPAKVVVRGGYYGRYVAVPRPSLVGGSRDRGYLLYLQQGTLFAVRFDLDRLEAVGQPVPAIENVAANPAVTGGAQLAFAADGTLVYIAGTATNVANPIDWIGRNGKTATLRAAKTKWANPRFSPDGQKLAVDIDDGKQRNIWVYDWARDTATQLSFGASQDENPVWTPDGKRIVFSSDRAAAGTENLYWINADGTGDVTRLTDSKANEVAESWHPSGRYLAYGSLGGINGIQTALMILPMEGDATRGWTPGKPYPFLATRGIKLAPVFSPDGRWIAYQSNEASLGGPNFEVYVRPFPGPGGPWRISNAGGAFPAWSSATREILFLEGSVAPRLMSAAYSVVGDSFRADAPQSWSPTVMRGASPYNHGYALHPDGTRVAALAGDNQSESARDKVVLMFNFADYLRAIAPDRTEGAKD